MFASGLTAMARASKHKRNPGERLLSGVLFCVNAIALVGFLDLDELCRRPLYRQLMELHAFDAAVVISGTGECRRYEVEYL